MLDQRIEAVLAKDVAHKCRGGHLDNVALGCGLLHVGAVQTQSLRHVAVLIEAVQLARCDVHGLDALVGQLLAKHAGRRVQLNHRDTSYLALQFGRAFQPCSGLAGVIPALYIPRAGHIKVNPDRDRVHTKCSFGKCLLHINLAYGGDACSRLEQAVHCAANKRPLGHHAGQRLRFDNRAAAYVTKSSQLTAGDNETTGCPIIIKQTLGVEVVQEGSLSISGVQVDTRLFLDKLCPLVVYVKLLREERTEGANSHTGRRPANSGGDGAGGKHRSLLG